MGSGTRGKNKNKKSGQSSGFQFNAPVTAKDQTFINGDVENLSINQVFSGDELKQWDELFRSFKEQLKQAAPPDKQNQVEEKVQELHGELSKGQNANTDRLNKVIDGLLELVPGASSAVASMFGTPILGALVGPVTKMVLDHIKK
jgi:hypothetical protein